MSEEELNRDLGAFAKRYTGLQEKIACLKERLCKISTKLADDSQSLREAARGHLRPSELSMESEMVNETIRQMQEAIDQRERVAAKMRETTLKGLVTHTHPQGLPDSLLFELGEHLS